MLGEGKKFSRHEILRALEMPGPFLMSGLGTRQERSKERVLLDLSVCLSEEE